MAITNNLSFASIVILTLLISGKRHGYEMMRTVEEKLPRKIGPGTFYRTLTNLYYGELIEPVSANNDETDERRKYYQITSAGLAQVKAELDMFQALIDMSKASKE